MSDPLYRKELLRLAADATGAGRLPHPDATGTAHNQVCGDKVTVDLALEDGRIAGMAHDTKACVLAQASASLLGAEIAGLNREEVGELHKSVCAMLAEGANPPPVPFNAYAAFDGVGVHTKRHRCVLLPIEAVLTAFEALETSKKGGEGT